MFKYLNPSYIFTITGKILNVLKFIVTPIKIIGVIFSVFVSPIDYIQGDAVRIMYIHVPSAWISLICFAAISFLAILNFLS